jgi:hypothetical protein
LLAAFERAAERFGGIQHAVILTDEGDQPPPTNR